MGLLTDASASHYLSSAVCIFEDLDLDMNTNVSVAYVNCGHYYAMLLMSCRRDIAMVRHLEIYIVTARRHYASAVLGVVILSIRPSVCHLPTL